MIDITLKREERHDIYKNAKETFLLYTKNKEEIIHGICYYLTSELDSLGLVTPEQVSDEPNYNFLFDVFPEFAQFKKEDRAYFWEHDDIKSRVEAFDIMIYET